MNQNHSTKKTVDLRKYHSEGALVMSGRPRGEHLRAELRLDVLDKSGESFVIVVPEEVISLNSSFFLGLFGKSVIELGPDLFDQKYRFKCNRLVERDIERGKRQALVRTNPLVF